jgi:hypothetical protein
LEKQYDIIIGKGPTNADIRYIETTNGGSLKKLLNEYDELRAKFVEGTGDYDRLLKSGEKVEMVIRKELDFIDNPKFDPSPDDLNYRDRLMELRRRSARQLEELREERNTVPSRWKLQKLGKGGR